MLSAFCAYTKLDISNELRKAERQCTIKPERRPEGEIHKEKVRYSFKLFYRQQNMPAQKCNYCFLLFLSTLFIQVTA